MNGIESLTPPSTDGTETTILKDDPTWKEGDFVLVSSDGWRFRVPSHPLLSHSTVLCDAQDFCRGDKEVKFTDPVIETRAIISRFLQLIMNYTIGEVEAPLDLAERLWSGMKIAKPMSEDTIAPLHAFMIGALLDDPELCYFSIEKEMLNMKKFGHKYFQALDLANFPITLWDRIPPEYMLALNKSKPAVVEGILGPATAFIREISMARDIRSSPESK
ncbi:hypothetical protein A1Q1_02944 [Trichosporon asahii var. asahii CBS 2479]|uniref:BTB domain-containing protein n=1 Tax=Trichosporon asahii var. asahii (strain ATCC 90039 / CBS 2479 / JCM 2466 / KCTC 7840 / NBRC 103889/ NCYC 2677 / UAMH 7654) TaxID=1186058 RepID=J5QLZ8_TRIAS|nr:hypothetical protein A1Q1_02944 [Trichosporon asahii var. asahii CBS 2479]EJT48028.1 hypothetical protein A1Q1_02944 [Trichosporon asahii var. asahii CBS 2479]